MNEYDHKYNNKNKRCMFTLTIDGESRGGGELGHVHNLDGELLVGLPVNASPNQTEGTSATEGRPCLEAESNKRTRGKGAAKWM